MLGNVHLASTTRSLHQKCLFLPVTLFPIYHSLESTDEISVTKGMRL